MKPINLLHRKLEKLKSRYGCVDIKYLTKFEIKQLGKPVEITNVRFEEK
jgi:hypothetical protein